MRRGEFHHMMMRHEPRDIDRAALGFKRDEMDRIDQVPHIAVDFADERVEPRHVGVEAILQKARLAVHHAP